MLCVCGVCGDKAAYGDFGSLKELKITARRRSAYREIEEQESLSNFISLRQPFRCTPPLPHHQPTTTSHLACGVCGRACAACVVR